MKRLHFNIITSIIAIVFIAILVAGNMFFEYSTVATVPGSYAEQFANKKGLKQIEVADSIKGMMDIRYETFEYNTTAQGTLSLEKYNGINKDLMLPEYINGVRVTEIGENFFTNECLNSVYIPETINKIRANPNGNIILYCDKDSQFYKDFCVKEERKENSDEESWITDAALDSINYNPECSDIPFSYNVNGDSVDIVSYTGNDTIIAIPSYIDGRTVTKVSFDILGKYDVVVFPATVTEISGKVSALIYSTIFIIELIFTIIAFIIVIIAVNKILPNYRGRKEEYMLSGSQMVLTFLYLAAQITLCIRFIYFAYIPVIFALLISVALMAAYIVLVLLASQGKEHVYKVNDQAAQETASVRSLQSMVRGMADGIKDPEMKKAVTRMVEEIRYSAARSKNTEIEVQIAEKIEALKALVKAEEKEKVIDECQTIIELMKSR